MTRPKSLGVLCIAFAYAADQISKSVATAYSDILADGIPVVPGFRPDFSAK